MTTPIAPGDKLGAYRLGRRVGEGGFGQVWQAEDPHGARVAVKILKPVQGTSLDSFRGWFTREYMTGSRIDSKYVAAPIDADLKGELPWIAFPFIEGRTLRRLIDSEPLTHARIDQIAVQILRGLVDLHEAELVHRDIKPANIMISPGDRVTILDLGIVHDPTATKITRGPQPGTPGYLAPEAWQGLTAGPAMDIWAFAQTVIDMFFPESRRSGEIPALQAVRDVHPRWADIIQACLVTEPDRRPAASTVIRWITEPGLPVEQSITPSHETRVRHNSGRPVGPPAYSHPGPAGLPPRSSDDILRPNNRPTPSPDQANRQPHSDQPAHGKRPPAGSVHPQRGAGTPRAGQQSPRPRNDKSRNRSTATRSRRLGKIAALATSAAVVVAVLVGGSPVIGQMDRSAANPPRDAPAPTSSASTGLPTVRLLAPASGSTISGSTRIVVAASGGFPIQAVSVSGRDARMLPDGTWEFVLDTVSHSGGYDGEDVIRVVATDSKGVSSEELVVPVVINNHHPTASMYSLPAAGSTLSGTVTVMAATALDDKGRDADSVDVYVDDKLVGQADEDSYGSPYEYALDTGKFANGWHTIAVGANDGNHEPISERRRVLFSNSPGGPEVDRATATPGI